MNIPLADQLRRRKLPLAIAAGVLLVVIAVLSLQNDPDPAAGWRTEPASRGNLLITVSATGNVQPTNQVDVGSELSGIVAGVLVEENDSVKKGQVLARLDTTKLDNQVTRARAALRSAEAGVQQATATVRETQAELARLRQVHELSGGKVPSANDLESAEAVVARALAGEASARAAVEEARAALGSAETDLAKASIRSPINGVVLTRSIEPGQTVAASLQAPVLFTLAEDLGRMELKVDIDEADVGKVRAGQNATFSVDAWADRDYPAQVTRVSWGAQTVSGVVSYKATLAVDNRDLSLRPGMTATATINATERNGVLLVPNAALRFTPPDADASQNSSLVSKLMPRPGAQQRPKRAGSTQRSGQRQVHVLVDGQPQAVSVTIGESDGRMTEITGGDLAEGSAVIIEYTGNKP